MTQTTDKAAAIEELSQWIGREIVHDGVDEVSRNDIRRKLEVFCFDCPIYTDDEVARAHGYRMACAPRALTPLWAMPAYWTPGDPPLFGPGLPEKNGGHDLPVPSPWSNSLNAASEVMYFEPVYPGDRLRSAQKLIEIKQRSTRLGEGAFLTFETTISKRTGEKVWVRTNANFRYDRNPDRASRPKDDGAESAAPRIPADVAPHSDPVDWSRQLRAGEVAVDAEIPPYHLWLSYQRIVMSIAVDRMYSGIHHNRDFAREAGLDDIIFNTRGYEALLEFTLRRWIGLDGRLVKIGPFRMIKNAHPGDTLVCGGRVTAVEPTEGRVALAFWVDSPRGRHAQGEAVVAIPAG